MTTANVIAFLQPGVQPGLKARSGGEAGENPFAALLASLGLETTPENGPVKVTAVYAAGTDKAQAPANALPAPLQLLKDIGEAIAKALEDGTELPEFDQLPPEFQALLAQFAQLPDDLRTSLETLIGTAAVAALDELAASAGDTPPQAAPPVEGASDQASDTTPPGSATVADAGETAQAKAQAVPASSAPATPPGEQNAAPAQPAAASASAIQEGKPEPATADTPRPVTTAAQTTAGQTASAQPEAVVVTDDRSIDAIPDAAAKASTRPAAPATQAAAAAVLNAATPSRVQQQASGAASTDTPSKDDVARAETTARDTTRNGLRGLLETLAAGPQASDAATTSAGTRAQAPQALAAAIQSAVSARAGSEPSANAPASKDIASVGAPQGDSILLTLDKPGQAAFANAPARSVTVPAYGSSLPVSQIALTISSQARAGTRHFDIRLDPPEMGRIDVRLEMSRDGVLNAQLTVDRPETFDALNRDARHLERMLQQSGMKLDGSSIQFSLRDGGGSGNGQAFDNQNGSGNGNSSPTADPEADVPAPVYARIPSSALVDIEV